MQTTGKSARIFSIKGGLFEKRKEHPRIAISGHWLEEMGLKPDDRIKIKVVKKNIVISRKK